jgi:hypothetical protein
MYLGIQYIQFNIFFELKKAGYNKALMLGKEGFKGCSLNL